MMHLFIIGFTVLMAIGMGWSIGANDAANSMGTAVGARVLTLKQAIVLIAIFGFLGAALQGQHVSKTIGKGIVDLTNPALRDSGQATQIALVATLASCLWVVLATYWKMPISTSHSIVGAVAGAGLAVHAEVHWRVLHGIFACWVLTPAGAALIGYIFYLLLRWLYPRLVPERYSRKTLTLLIILSGCYVAYSWGANDVANATGIVQGAGILPGYMAVILGGAAIVLGVLTWGYKVIETIGSGIAHLLPLMAFSAQLASAINVHVYTVMGIPVSTSHSIVGAIFGVGLVQGVQVVNMLIMREIVVCWLATPFISGVLSFVMLKVIVWLPGAR
jgi:PiT family inorganic phosphate transporter